MMQTQLSIKSRISHLWRSALPYIVILSCIVFVLVLVVGSFVLLIDLFQKSLPLAIGLLIFMGLVFIGCVKVITNDIESQRYLFD